MIRPVFSEETLRNNFNRNINYLTKNYPQLLQMFSAQNSALHVKVDPEGRIDALVGSLMVYGGDAYRKSLEQFRKFEQSPVKLMAPLKIKGYTNSTLISDKFGLKIIELVGDEISTPEQPVEDYIPFLLVVGLGFGLHLQMLLERYYVHHLMVVDIPMFAQLSLYTLDWQAIVEDFNKPDRSMTLMISDDFLKPEMVDTKMQEVVSIISTIGPAAFYWGYYFEHLGYNPPLLLKEWLSKHVTVMDFFKGFFDDELWSLEWTIEKVQKRIPLFYGGHSVPDGSVAFVVGAGPSLDATMETLLQNRNKAIIFSCGSSITALEKVGLVPDYHIEVERTKATYDVLAEVNRDFLKRTILIANNPLWTDTFDLFMEGYMFRKINDAGASLLGNTGAPFIWNTGPTVTASGVAVAAALGFKEIYLFGVDLGSRDPQYHHSKATNYYNEKSILYKNSTKLDVPYPANFGGTAYTNTWFWQTAKAIQATIRKKGVRIYNLSDGIRIEGAIPLRHQELKLERVLDKQLIKNTISKNFRTDYVQYVNIQHLKSHMDKSFNSLILKVDSLLKRNYVNIKDVASAISEIARYLKECGETVFSLLYHNTYLWTTALLGRAIGLESVERDRIVKTFLEIYSNFLKEAHGAVRQVMEKGVSKVKEQRR